MNRARPMAARLTIRTIRDYLLFAIRVFQTPTVVSIHTLYFDPLIDSEI